MNISSYKTVKASEAEALDHGVTAAIQEGWEPFGDPYAIHNGILIMFFQAMVKEKRRVEALMPRCAPAVDFKLYHYLSRR